jgi:hypothetical protein
LFLPSFCGCGQAIKERIGTEIEIWVRGQSSLSGTFARLTHCPLT